MGTGRIHGGTAVLGCPAERSEALDHSPVILSEAVEGPLARRCWEGPRKEFPPQSEPTEEMSRSLHHKILSPGMMHHQCRSTLLWLQKKSRSQPHPNILLRAKQSKQLRLIFQIRASWIPKRIPRPAILLMKQIANRRSILARNPQLLPHSLMMQLCQSLGGFYAQPMQIQILRILSTLKQLLSLNRSLCPDSNQRKSNHIHLPRSFGGKEIGNTESAPLPLPRKSKPQQLPPIITGLCHSERKRGICCLRLPIPAAIVRWHVIHHHIIPITQARKIPVNHLRLKQPGPSHFLFQSSS